MKHRFAQLFLCAALIAFAMQPAGAEGPTPRSALAQDAFQYAQQFHVPIAQARNRLRWQGLAGDLEAKLRELYPATFAGLWIEHTPEFRVVALLTKPEEARRSVPRLIAGSSLVGRVEIQRAQRSLKELEDQKVLARAAVRKLGALADFDIDVQANTVVLYTASKSEIERAIAENRLRLPPDVSVVEVEALASPVANIYGGLAGSGCTLGFSVISGSGSRGISTAAHCGNFQANAGVWLPFQAECFHDDCDVQWHTDSSHTAQPWVKAGNFTRSIYDTRSRAQQAIGAYVCKQGITTGFTCGTISSKNIAPSYIPSANATFIRVAGGSTDQSEPGDSGGPWFSGNTAYGIMSCQFLGTNDACYMAINYISSLNVTVLTTTPPPPPPPPSCEEYCYLDYEDCQVDFCYWDYDPYMCNIGCDDELDQCLLDC